MFPNFEYARKLSVDRLIIFYLYVQVDVLNSRGGGEFQPSNFKANLINSLHGGQDKSKSRRILLLLPF